MAGANVCRHKAGVQGIDYDLLWIDPLRQFMRE